MRSMLYLAHPPISEYAIHREIRLLREDLDDGIDIADRWISEPGKKLDELLGWVASGGHDQAIRELERMLRNVARSRIEEREEV